MAKDGTNRGGARPGAGRKPKALADKLAEGNPGHRPLKVVELPKGAELSGAEMPPVKEYLTAEQAEGEFQAARIYEDTWKWLQERGCERLVNIQLIEEYAMSAARWIQCEQALSEYGLLGQHPTTGATTQSPYVSMAQSYLKQTNQIWCQIYQIVRENCSKEYKGATPQEDLMEQLLRSKSSTG